MASPTRVGVIFLARYIRTRNEYIKNFTRSSIEQSQQILEVKIKIHSKSFYSNASVLCVGFWDIHT